MPRYRSNHRSNYKPRSLRRMEKRSKTNIIISIGLGIVLVYFMFVWGLPALIGGLSVFNKFKPSEKVTSISEDTAIAPPVLNIPYEATNTAVIKISGFSTPKSKVEVYLDDELKTTATCEDDGSFITDNIQLSLGNNNIYGQTLGDNQKKSLPSKTIRLTYSNEKPKLELSEPVDGQQITGGDKKIKTSGKTDAINSVTINGDTVIVSADGSFSKDVILNDGDNTITVIASTPVGNTSQVARKVTYISSPTPSP